MNRKPNLCFLNFRRIYHRESARDRSEQAPLVRIGHRRHLSQILWYCKKEKSNIPVNQLRAESINVVPVFRCKKIVCMIRVLIALWQLLNCILVAQNTDIMFYVAKENMKY